MAEYYEWGTIPKYERTEPLTEDAILPKGQYMIIENHVFKNQKLVFEKPKIEDLQRDYISQIEAKGGKVHYIKCSLETEKTFWEYYIEGYLYTFTVEKCIVESDPIPVAVIYGIIILLGILLVFYRPTVNKLVGVTPSEQIISDIGSMGIFIVLAIAIVLVLGALGKGKK